MTVAARTAISVLGNSARTASPKKFHDSTFVALHGAARERLQDFDQLQRATFVLCGTLAVAGDIRKPERREMMGKRRFFASNFGAI